MTRDYLSERMIGGLYTESVGEYTLPDFNPDVRKVLSVFPVVTRAECFTDDSGALYTGGVNYSIVYLDFENNLSHCEFSTDYEYRAKCDMERYVDSSADTVITNYNVRLVGPRKFSAKCALSGAVRISERSEIEVGGDTLSSNGAEILSDEISVGKFVKGRCSEREYAETVEHIDGVMEDECEVLVCTAEVRSDSVTLGSTGGTHKGVITVSCLVSCAGEVAHAAKCEIPFEDKFFEGESVSDSSDVSARVEITSLKCNVVPDENGVNIVASVITEGEMVAYSVSKEKIIEDSYSTERGCENKYGAISYREYLGTSDSKCEVTDRLLFSEVGCEGVRNVIFSDASARIGDIKISDGRAEIKGEVRFSGIACQINDDGQPTYSGIRVDVPLSHSLGLATRLSDGDKIYATAECSDAAIEVDSTHLIPRCNTLIRITAHRDCSHACLLSSNLTDERFDDDSGVVTVYYPDHGETLFDIAKKYHKSLVSVAGVNSITEEVFRDTSSAITSHGFKKIIIR